MAGPKYYPILKWKAGEHGAMKQMAAADRALMLPILELAPATGGPSATALVASLDKTQVASTLPVAVDLRPALPAVTFAALHKVCSAGTRAGFLVWPVVQAPDLFAQLHNLAALNGCPGIVLRLRLQVLNLAATLAAIAAVRKAIGKVPLHVVYDLGPIGEVATGALAAFAEPFVRDTFAQGIANHVALAGGSFPLSLTGFPIGNNLLPRREWLAWQDLRTRAGCADVRFGDYNVTNPDPLGDIDPRAMNPAAAIRYALDGEWWLLRARGAKTSGFDQYNTLCRVLVADPRYYGAGFSYGDGRYHFHAQPGASTGNFMTWRRDAASHHLVQTVRALDLLI